MQTTPTKQRLRDHPPLPRLLGALAPLLLLLALSALPAAAQPYAPPERLEAAAADLRQVASSGGWTQVPEGSVLREGDTGERVAALRRRLAEVGLLSSAEGREYTAEVAEAVETFQARHNITVDGIAGPETLDALNVSAAERAEQAARAAELQRQFLAEHGDASRYVLVNVPAFELKLVENGAPALAMKVIVGQEGWGTPEMHERIEYLVANPDWDVPASIVAADIAPQVAADPGYLAANDMIVLSGWGADAERVDPSTIDWSGVTEASWSYHLRQLPGPDNPLGQLKFMFPNENNIYLHGTPAEQLFEKDQRGLSHGCIRVEDPVALGARLLARTSGWDRARLERVVGQDEQQRIELDGTVPVHLVYWTAYVDRDGTLRFAPDLYGRRG